MERAKQVSDWCGQRNAFEEKLREINSQSLEDTQDKNTSEKCTLKNTLQAIEKYTNTNFLDFFTPRDIGTE